MLQLQQFAGFPRLEGSAQRFPVLESVSMRDPEVLIDTRNHIFVGIFMSLWSFGKRATMDMAVPNMGAPSCGWPDS